MKAGRQILLILLLLVVAGAGWYLFGRGGDSDGQATLATPQGQPAGRAGGRPTIVVTAPVTVDDAGEEVRAIGTLAAAQEVTLYPEVTGIVAAILFKANEQVKAGDVLVRLDDEDQKVEVQRATIARDDARAALDRFEKLFATKNTTAVSVSDARSVLEKAEIDLKVAQLALAKRAITAPFSGTVGISDLSVGDLVTTAKPIVNLADMSTAEVSFEVPERIAGRVAVGDTVAASTPALPGQTFEGKLTAIDNRLDTTSRTLRVKAEVPNPDSVLKPGMSVAAVLSFPAEGRPVVPSLAVQWDRQGSFVWKIDGDTAHRTPITVVQRKSGAVTVTGPLAAGDAVVVEGLQRVRDGARVARASETGEDG
jgi:RND family efflux transporter MFP subunit